MGSECFKALIQTYITLGKAKPKERVCLKRMLIRNDAAVAQSGRASA